jgi:hypothetical protein
LRLLKLVGEAEEEIEKYVTFKFQQFKQQLRTIDEGNQTNLSAWYIPTIIRDLEIRRLHSQPVKEYQAAYEMPLFSPGSVLKKSNEEEEQAEQQMISGESYNLKTLMANERTFVSWMSVIIGVGSSVSLLSDNIMLNAVSLGLAWLGFLIFYLRRREIQASKTGLVIKSGYFAGILGFYVLVSLIYKIKVDI